MGKIDSARSYTKAIRSIILFLIPLHSFKLKIISPSKVNVNVFVTASFASVPIRSFRSSGRNRISSASRTNTVFANCNQNMNMPTSSSSSPPKKKEHNVSIHWFRNGLRFHDNRPLHDACTKSNFVLPIYIIDPTSPFCQTGGRRAGVIRANFILESLKYISDKLSLKGGDADKDGGEKKNEKSGTGSKLLLFVGRPIDVLPQLIQELDVDAIFYEREPATPIKEADSRVLDAIDVNINKDKGINSTSKKCIIHGYDTHTLFPMEEYLSKCTNNVAPSSYGAFTKIFQKLGPVPDELPSIIGTTEEAAGNNKSDTDVNMVPSLPKSYSSKIQNLIDNKDLEIQIIDLEQTSNVDILESYLGYKDVEQRLSTRNKGGLSFKGGEDVGLNLLHTMCSRTKWIWKFEKPKTKPNALTVDTTGLSPYVKHGCVSPRTFYHELSKVYATCPNPDKTLSKPPVSLHGQLMWREYNYLMAYTTPNFDTMVDNPIARQIPWDDDPVLLNAWRNGRTGYPYIDAVMTQLKETGWIHHLARHSAACFLTRGDLWQSWEKGAEVFEEELIDADWSINNFNWQWLSCTAHFYQYFRCYSPVAFGEKTDKNGDYIRKWLPQFKDFPKGYIFEPWKAPLSVQQKAGVIIGKDYPEPICDHKTISKSNMGRMKLAYDEHKAAVAKVKQELKKPAKKRAKTTR